MSEPKPQTHSQAKGTIQPLRHQLISQNTEAKLEDSQTDKLGWHFPTISSELNSYWWRKKEFHVRF